MTLQSRLTRLEIHAGEPTEHCSACGYPANASAHVVLRSEDEPLGECEDCGRQLRTDGRPLEWRYKCIILSGGEDAV